MTTITKPTDQQTTRLMNYLERLVARRFFGTLELRFESGSIVHLIEHRSFKPADLSLSDHLRCSDDDG